MKKFFLLSIACLTLSATAQVDASKVSKVYETRIQKREMKVTSFEVQKHETKLITAESLKPEKKEVEDSRFVGLLKAAKRAATFKANGEKQTLDSLIRYQGMGETGLYGSKQEFHYNEDGQPVQCVNYLPNEETGLGWRYVGEYVYEYDDFGRMIAATSTNEDGYSYGEKYEYIYDEDGKPYTMLIYYYQEGGGDWMPRQYAAYDYDAQNRTINEEYYYTQDGGETWIGNSKNTASYNEQGWMTSYYAYEWDWDKNQWKGSSYEDGQIFHYRADGQDDWIESFVWENDQWSNYCHEYFTYDENDRLILQEYKYWNRAMQDWLGGDVWGDWGFIENNRKNEYTYDENGRRPLEEAYSYNRESDIYTLTFKRTREFTELENGHLNNEEKVYYPFTGSELSLYNHRTITTNRFGSEIYYLNRNYAGDGQPLRKTEETIRDIDDSNNRYYSGYFYSFTNDEANTRYGSIYEYCLYDEDGNVTCTHHMSGTGINTDTEWIERDDAQFGYEKDAEGNSVMVKYDFDSYENGEWIDYEGFEKMYDFTVNRDDVIIWPMSNKSNSFYLYKTLQEYSYVYYSWINTLMEYTDVYYYSDGGQGTGIEELKVTPQFTGKVQYFDVQGRRVNADARGIIIVRDANGNAYKIIK